jgi:hypothetical protein
MHKMFVAYAFLFTLTNGEVLVSPVRFSPVKESQAKTKHMIIEKSTAVSKSSKISRHHFLPKNNLLNNTSQLHNNCLFLSFL